MQYVTVGNGRRIHICPGDTWSTMGGWTFCGIWADGWVRDPKGITAEDICRTCRGRLPLDIPDSWIAAAAGEGRIDV